MPSIRRLPLVLPALLFSALLSLLPDSAARAEEGLRFEITLDENAAEAPVTGRLYVFLSRRGGREPRFGPNWFAPEPFFGVDVEAVQPGATRVIDDTADGFPEKLSHLPAGRYQTQAVLDHDFDNPHHATGPGNFYSGVATVNLDPAQPETIRMTLDQVVKERPFPTTRWVREVAIRSKLLSDFHKRKVVERASVVLPRDYYQHPDRRYPTIYIIPGFGGSHLPPRTYANGSPPAGEGETEFVRVYLSGRCKWGHHVYADSATNGPRGAALVEEMIPRIDANYRTVAAPTARFVTGASSGGWSSLWLQVTYPEVFGGVWSISPDPVDFRDYQQVNLYAHPPLSLYTDERGERRPIARRGERPVLWYDSFGRMDDVLKRGGQLRSFEAVFSPLGEDGLPRMLWDRETGRIDPEVAQAWQKYDINLKLERNWDQLGPKLAGKLHIYTGGLDTFYLDGAVELLGETLKKLGSDAKVEVFPGKSHNLFGDVPGLTSRIRKEMSAAYFKHHGL